MGFFLGLLRVSATGLAACLMILAPVQAADKVISPILIGLDADLSAGVALGGEAIRRGAVIAIDEINSAGGLLGRSLKLVVRDHRGNPDRGVDNINDFAKMADLVAVMGGVHTPVAMAELEVIHDHDLIYLGPWAAGTGVVDNGYDPSFVFRASVRDEFAGEFLIRAAVERGSKRPGLLLWQTAWGRSNETAMLEALAARGTKPAGIEWFNTGARSVTKQLEALRRAGADAVLLVAQPDGAITTVKDMAAMSAENRLPLIAHWGFTGGRFHHAVRSQLDMVDLVFLQTFSFFDPPFPKRAKRLLDAYCRRFSACNGPADVFSPVGTAHAYDLVHLLALAIEKAGVIDRPKIRRALEELGRYEGLVRNYDPPFTPERHDALDESDFRLAIYDEDGAIVPAVEK